MSLRAQFCFWLFCGSLLTALAQPQPPTPGLLMPPAPSPQPLASPIAFFRKLLVMPPAERIAALTNRSPEAQERIRAKIREYLALDPNERELRLQATELRWWLAPLFKLSPADRATRISQAPAEWQGILTARLNQWDSLPADLKQEFLANEQTLHYFARVAGADNAPATAEQQKLAAQFNQFYELSPAEKSRALNQLSSAEKAAMERTLHAFDQLPPPQRLACVRNYTKFTGMSAADRSEFLKNADSWSKMSPQERQSWRDLVSRIPIQPPLPMPVIPANLIPHPTPPPTRPSVATN